MVALFFQNAESMFLIFIKKCRYSEMNIPHYVYLELTEVGVFVSFHDHSIYLTHLELSFWCEKIKEISRNKDGDSVAFGCSFESGCHVYIGR